MSLFDRLKKIRPSMEWIPFYTYLTGKKLLKEPNINERLIASGEYPKVIESPVDIEYNKEAMRDLAFFNFNKWIRFVRIEWMFRKFPQVQRKIDEMTYNNSRLAEYADGLHDRIQTYNELSPAEQFEQDLKKPLRRSIFVSIILLFFAFHLGTEVFPSMFASSGEKNYNAGNYQAALSDFQKGNDEYSKKMVQLSRMQLEVQKGNKEEALEIAEQMRGVSIGSRPTDDLDREVHYKIGLMHEKKKEYYQAAMEFLAAGDYSDALSRMTLSGYKSYEGLKKDKEHEKIIKLFSHMVGYQDSEELLLKAMEAYYLEGLQAYDNLNFDTATKHFKLLAKYEYKNAQTLLYESNYQTGIQYLESGKIKEGIALLEEIAFFKDTRSILKETYYKQATMLVSNAPNEALQYLLKAYNYKEANKLLLNGSVVIYGNWLVTEQNGATIQDTHFSFNSQNQVRIIGDESGEVSKLFLSEDYRYENGRFVFGKRYFEVIEVTDVNTIKLKVDETVLKLEREKPLSTMVTSKNMSSLFDDFVQFFETDELTEEGIQKEKETTESSSDDEFEL